MTSRGEVERPVAPEGTGPVPHVDAPKVCPSCGTRYPVDALFCSLDGAPLTTSRGVIAAAAATDAYLGREILGHIEIRQLVGIGAMGRVYRAFQKGIDRDVAVKVLHRELSSNQTLVARFHREAKVASRLAHPNVVHVLLVGQLPDGAMYIVMEYLDGMSLQSALAAASGSLPLPRALHIALQLCDAAGEAHAQGVVHRDLKPENVMLVHRADDPDFVKVLDFGIARLNWGEPSMATAAGLIFGTARYISPEGARGEQVGPEGDVYSIATMLYQMLAGRAPFEADQAVALLVQQIHDAPPPLRTLPRASYVPEAVAAVVMRNLSKAPADRASNGRAFARDLLDAAVASGMSAQDILTRRGLVGPSRVAPISTSLEAPAPEAMDAAPAGGGARSPARTEIVDGRAGEARPQGRGATTTKWAPSSDFQRKVQAGPPSKPPSSVDATIAGDETSAPAPAPAAPIPTTTLHGTLLVALCFGVGVAGMALVAWRVGAMGRGSIHPAVIAPPGSVIAAPSETPAPPPAAEVVAAPLPPLDDGPPRAASARGATSASASAVPSAARVAIDASAARPGVGQPVDFAARVTGGGAPSGSPRAHLDGARFRITGPGIAQGAEIAAGDDGTGIYRTTFTFLQAGRFEVDFSARADGALVHGLRPILVGLIGDVPGAPAPPLPAAPAATALPPPPAPASAPAQSAAGTKWM